MNPLSAIYGLAVRTSNALYDYGALPTRRLQRPVISIGNLSVGGTGKTPFVIMLGRLLHERGIKFDVLSRGYGRTSRGVVLVDPAGSAQQFGDEPLLITRRLGVPVIIAGDRYEAGLFAEKQFGTQMHLLDDGFQHRCLARDFDIVLFTEQDQHDTLLPLGRLREPLAALQRADVVVLSNFAAASVIPDKPHWHIQRGIDVPQQIPERPLVFCGIARPADFVQQLKQAGICPIAEGFYRDHHAYSQSDIRDLISLRNKAGAGGFITTEKDAVNLGSLAGELQPLSVIPVRMALLDPIAAMESMLATIDARRRHETIPLT